MIRQGGHQGVARLVHGDGVAFFGQQDVGAVAPSKEHPVAGVVEVLGGHHLTVVADREDRRLVEEVAEIRARKAGGSAGGHVQIDVRVQLLAAGVDRQDGSAFQVGGQGHRHLPVEPARAQQGRVQGLRPVGGGKDDDVVVVVEAVHLGEQLVERLLALVVTAEALSAAAADRVDLIDEDDGRPTLAGIGKQVPHPGCPDPDEHLDEA